MKTFKEFIKLTEQSASDTIIDAEFTDAPRPRNRTSPISRLASRVLPRALRVLPIVSRAEPHVYAAGLGLNAGSTATGKVKVKGSDGKSYYMDK